MLAVGEDTCVPLKVAQSAQRVMQRRRPNRALAADGFTDWDLIAWRGNGGYSLGICTGGSERTGKAVCPTDRGDQNALQSCCHRKDIRALAFSQCRRTCNGTVRTVGKVSAVDL